MKYPNLHKRFPKGSLLIAAALMLALSFLSSFYFFTETSIGAERNNLQQYIHQQQKDFQEVIADTALMRQLVQQKVPMEAFTKLDEKRYGIFLYAETINTTPQYLFWNDNKILPPTANFNQPDGEYFESLQNGYYVYEKHTIRLAGISSNVIAYAMIPVLSQYRAESEYLINQFAHSSEAHKKIRLDTLTTPYPVQSLRGTVLFYIGKNKEEKQRHNALIIVLQVAGMILILAYIHFAAETIMRKRGMMAGLGFLAATLLLIRVLLYLLPEPFYFLQTRLFDAEIFEKGSIYTSLGDLLLNALFFCWISVFAWYSTGPHRQLPLYLSGRRLLVAGIAALSFLVWTTFQLADVVRTLVANTSISFNVNDFFSLNFYTVVGFVVLALLSLGYYYFSRLLFKIIFPAFKQPVYVYFLLPVMGLVYLTLIPGNAAILFHLPVLVWLVIYTLLLSGNQLVINRFRINIAGVLFWIIVFSISLATIILKENRDKELENRKEYAKSLNQGISTEVIADLNIGTRYINNRFLFENLSRLAHPAQSRLLRDSLSKPHLSKGFANNYNVTFYFFDSLDRAQNNVDSLSLYELNEIYTKRSKPTASEGINLYERSFGEYAFIIKRTISDSLKQLGNFFIVATPKRFKKEVFSFELFGQVDRRNAQNTRIYSYAIYKKGELISSENSFFPFSTKIGAIEIPYGDFRRETKDGYDFLWYNAGPDEILPDKTLGADRIFLIVKKEDKIIESITLFSYLFCAFLVMIALIKCVSILLKSGNNWQALQAFWQLNIRSQVQGTVIFVSVLSFIVIGIVTISFFIERYNRNNQEDLLRISDVLVSELEQNLPVESDSTGNPNIFDVAYTNQVKNFIKRIADLHNVDVSIYDIYGNLYATSSDELYDRGIMSEKMHPKAYYHLHRMNQVQFIQNEAISSLQYLSIYTPIRDDSGETRSYMNIPFYSSEVELEQEISNFLVAIINLNAFVFLIAGTIAVFITNKITRSFSVIGDKMKAITLGRTNEEIEWNRNDEIGELVKQYNKMVRQLEQSAEALAKSEREGAWREMARQVAHEIKNPLTPMKLSIQYLQKAITNGHGNVKDLTTNVASTLIEQIDHLSKIAADFGRFANIGNPQLEVFDLHAVLESLRDLYKTNQDVELHWQRLAGEIVIEADRTHMNRLFTNLLTNAIDACNNQPRCRIDIIEELEEDAILIQIRDTGEGIPEHMQPKIFTPNFTTKTSGTGLGLAICKSIVEQAGGKIWFTTEQGVGTTFFVSLPLADTF